MDKNRITLFLQFCVALLAVACLVPPRTAGAQDPPRVVEISAKRFGFTPNQVTLKNGETVTLRLTSEEDRVAWSRAEAIRAAALARRALERATQGAP